MISTVPGFYIIKSVLRNANYFLIFLEKCFLKCTFPHFWLTCDPYYLVASSRAVTEQPGQLPFFLDFLKNFAVFLFFLQLCHFYWLQISSVSCQSEKFLPLFLSPRSFILRWAQFILQCLCKKTFHILAKKQAFAKWNSLHGVLSKSWLPTRGAAKELSGQLYSLSYFSKSLAGSRKHSLPKPPLPF